MSIRFIITIIKNIESGQAASNSNGNALSVSCGANIAIAMPMATSPTNTLQSKHMPKALNFVFIVLLLFKTGTIL